ncbi:hypothetical protein HMN09_00741300 [Mycena chlorophos]|uniref:C2H2-type domain-containing protein n=1 Tax=Mycena chlorophos TaxID=658473 RepID=A0A8H6SUS7_MYCCL|nr:hypothetical protein HMN09_00741300 [Mycena chlorophos]
MSMAVSSFLPNAATPAYASPTHNQPPYHTYDYNNNHRMAHQQSRGYGNPYQQGSSSFSDGSASPPPNEYPQYQSRAAAYPRPGYYPSVAPNSPGSGGYPPSSGYPPYNTSGYPYFRGQATSPPPLPISPTPPQSPTSRTFIPTPTETYSRPPRPASAMHHRPPYPTKKPSSSTARESGSGSGSASGSGAASGSTSERYQCHICGKDFSRAHDRKRHFETQHSATPTQHKCRYCEKDFSRTAATKRPSSATVAAAATIKSPSEDNGGGYLGQTAKKRNKSNVRYILLARHLGQ